MTNIYLSDEKLLRWCFLYLLYDRACCPKAKLTELSGFIIIWFVKL